MANLERSQTMQKTAINPIASKTALPLVHTALRRTALLCAVFMVVLLLWSSSYAATLTSVVNRNQVGLNESFMLLLSIDEQVPSSALDLSPLRQDFEILGMSPNSSSSVSIINGQATRESSTSWRIALSPRRQGVLTVPALQVNGASSQAIAITVSAAPPSTAGDAALTAELRVDADTVLPEQQILVTITVSAASNVIDLSGPPLQIDNAEVVELTSDAQQIINNGIARQEVSLRYAVFAQAAGTVDIPSLTFTGSEGGSASIFSNRGRQVVARTQARTIAVQAVPTASPKPWLVADDITIETQWLSDAQAPRVGEPLTRRVSITAAGQQAEAIPPLLAATNDTAYRSYQDQAQLQSLSEAGGIRGIRNESEVILPNREGTLVLPAQQLRYWSTRTNRVETVTLAAETLNVLPAALSNEGINNANGNVNATDKGSALSNTNEPTHENQTSLAFGAQGSTLWGWVVMALAALCAVQTLYIIKIRRAAQRRNDPIEPAPYDPIAEDTAWAEVRALLKTKHGRAPLTMPEVKQALFRSLRKAILRWATTYLAKPVSVDSLASLLDKPGGQELRKLDHLAFARVPTQSLNVEVLSVALRQLRKTGHTSRLVGRKPPSKTTTSLPDLYPSSTDTRPSSTR